MQGLPMVYHVKREEVEQHLQYLEEKIPTLLVLSKMGEAELKQSEVSLLAAERLLHTCVEAVIDVAALVIDGLMMRDPGSYRDMVQILAEEGAFSADDAEALLRLVDFRHKLVRKYYALNTQDVPSHLQTAALKIPLFPSYIRKYLQQELF